jgi:hypothetical protein
MGVSWVVATFVTWLGSGFAAAGLIAANGRACAGQRWFYGAKKSEWNWFGFVRVMPIVAPWRRDWSPWLW